MPPGGRDLRRTGAPSHRATRRNHAASSPLNPSARRAPATTRTQPSSDVVGQRAPRLCPRPRTRRRNAATGPVVRWPQRTSVRARSAGRRPAATVIQSMTTHPRGRPNVGGMEVEMADALPPSSSSASRATSSSRRPASVTASLDLALQSRHERSAVRRHRWRYLGLERGEASGQAPGAPRGRRASSSQRLHEGGPSTRSSMMPVAPVDCVRRRSGRATGRPAAATSCSRMLALEDGETVPVGPVELEHPALLRRRTPPPSRPSASSSMRLSPRGVTQHFPQAAPSLCNNASSTAGRPVRSKASASTGPPGRASWRARHEVHVEMRHAVAEAQPVHLGRPVPLVDAHAPTRATSDQKPAASSGRQLGRLGDVTPAPDDIGVAGPHGIAAEVGVGPVPFDDAHAELVFVRLGPRTSAPVTAPQRREVRRPVLSPGSHVPQSANDNAVGF